MSPGLPAEETCLPPGQCGVKVTSLAGVCGQIECNPDSETLGQPLTLALRLPVLITVGNARPSLGPGVPGTEQVLRPISSAALTFLDQHKGGNTAEPPAPTSEEGSAPSGAQSGLPSGQPGIPASLCSCPLLSLTLGSSLTPGPTGFCLTTSFQPPR